ncbi:hypothetical protein DE146DRAFT_756106 [Phaeosphaeria sp. MPI-PUGE-AT-0046c]|nr:hypothetical protein DE146DRAFT_756106 [Phaeosphaeria sp. MPI-PUGE-AT-0046c]
MRRRRLASTIIHFDYDCFYASVFENENPALKSLPLAVQQKQIIVTCNYEARRRGLHKLQLITDAKKTCPDLVIVLGEDLTRFRNASKQLYAFLASFSWNARCERLGFDEVFMDVSDIVDYNAALLNHNHLSNSFFCLSKRDPTTGFAFDASKIAGYAFPHASIDSLDSTSQDPLHLRLLLAGHLAQYLRGRLDLEQGYTATVGISTNKVLAKLVGNVHKPNGQTTLLPPYTLKDDADDNVTLFMDSHEVGKIPGIGFKIAQKLRAHVLQRPADFDTGLVYGGTKESVSVRDVRLYPGMSSGTLEQLLSGPGAPHGIGSRVWELVNGDDSTDVGQARTVPTQISIEDSYIRLDTLEDVTKELRMLVTSLLKRMHTDLLEDEEDGNEISGPGKRWLAHPKTLRLSTRPRPPQNPNGARNRSFARISKSTSLPRFALSLKDSVDAVVERLVQETLLPLFRRLHSEKSGWNLSLVNVAVTNMMEGASEKGGVGRDIGKMFRRQDEVLREWRLVDDDDDDDDDVEGDTVKAVELELDVDEARKTEMADQETYPHVGDKVNDTDKVNFVQNYNVSLSRNGSEDVPTPSQQTAVADDAEWAEDEDMSDADADGDTYCCDNCGAIMPLFAMLPHERFHASNKS